MRIPLKGLGWFFIALLMIGLVLSISVYRHISSLLPDPKTLRDIEFQTPLEIYTREGRLIATFGDKKRIPVEIDDTPKILIQAFLAAEDARFYHHPGVDIQGLSRALVALIRTGHKRQGGSTITMQVARNFFLSPEKTYERKLKEILLAMKIERELSKNEILELYLNKIYLGHHAYGIAAASQIYYGKSLDQLDIAQAAMIAGLPKAPSRFNPVSNPERAMERRNYVLRRMLDLGFIDTVQYQSAISRPITATLNRPDQTSSAPYVAEWVRSYLYRHYGEEIYTKGFRVTTTLDMSLQSAAKKAVQYALHAYDERHGYRGPEGHIDPAAPLQAQTDALNALKQVEGVLPALVEGLDKKTGSAKLRLMSGKDIVLSWDGIKWARKSLPGNRLGRPPKRVEEVLHPGDLIRVRKDDNGKWRLAQIPEVQGALLSLDSRSGAILALQGGYDFHLSKFNRAIQSQRQPGSGFKPILYTAALESGFTAASLINDAPIVYHNAETDWRPENYSGKFYGPTRLRVALRNSRNLVSIRLLQSIGIDKVIETALRFGFKPQQLPKTPTLALGSGTATLLDMGRVFSVFANGGYRITPYIIEKVEIHNGEILEQAQPEKACDRCPDAAPRILSPRIHYLMHSLLQDVVRRGTAVRAKQLGRNDLAGKTGTTNDQRDAWFNGYASPLVAISWVGFDSSKPLGRGETGAKAALPMWMDYMKFALKAQPEFHFPMPEGLVTVQIDPSTGLRTDTQPTSITEIFRQEHVPDYQPVALQPTSGDQADSLLNSLY